MAVPGIAVTPNLSASDVKNQLIPPEGPKVVPFVLDFTTLASWDLNLINFQSRGQISIIQGVYADNSANANALTIFNQATGQTIQFPPFYQGYLPIFAVNPTDLLVSSVAAAIKVYIALYNVPIAPAIWPATSLGAQSATTAIKVQDTALEGALTGNALNIINYNYTNGDIVRKKFSANQTVRTFMAAGTTSVSLITGVPSFFVDWVSVYVSGNAAIAGGGEANVSLKDNNSFVLTSQYWCPDPAPTAPAPNHLIMSVGPGMGYISPNTAGVLTLVLNVAFLTGTLQVNVGCGTTTQN